MYTYIRVVIIQRKNTCTLPFVNNDGLLLVLNIIRKKNIFYIIMITLFFDEWLYFRCANRWNSTQEKSGFFFPQNALSKQYRDIHVQLTKFLYISKSADGIFMLPWMLLVFEGNQEIRGRTGRYTHHLNEHFIILAIKTLKKLNLCIMPCHCFIV